MRICLCFTWLSHLWSHFIGSSTSQDTASLESLPDDVMADVLSLLPADQVANLRRVCKGWCSLTATPYFVRLHLERSPPVMIFQTRSPEHIDHNKFTLFYVDWSSKKKKQLIREIGYNTVTSTATVALPFSASLLSSQLQLYPIPISPLPSHSNAQRNLHYSLSPLPPSSAAPSPLRPAPPKKTWRRKQPEQFAPGDDDSGPASTASVITLASATEKGVDKLLWPITNAAKPQELDWLGPAAGLPPSVATWELKFLVPDGEITGVSRLGGLSMKNRCEEASLHENGGSKKERMRRLWLPIARRAAQWFANTERRSQDSQNQNPRWTPEDV
ncbi:hypothetical protein NL676_013190 [Syzygium grande]|nr:hypothetical protein NL676_013190 [Syzygium grande]